jgi:hypothetical protein
VGAGPALGSSPADELSDAFSLLDEAVEMLRHHIWDPDTDDWRRWQFIAIRGAFDVLHALPDDPGISVSAPEQFMEGIELLRRGDAEPLEGVSYSVRQALSRLGHDVGPS